MTTALPTGMESTTVDVVGPRLVKKFSWEVVDPKLTRCLLQAVYEPGSPDWQLVHLLDGGPLARQAARTLGSPMKLSHVGDTFAVLKQHWVPQLSGEHLDELVYILSTTMSARERQLNLRTVAQKRAFLQAKNSTVNSRKNFHSTFIKAHKKPTPVRSTRPSGLRADASGVVHLAGEGRPPAHVPHPHQVEAWEWLDGEISAGSTVHSRSGLLVLPTGAGKTSTAVQWATRRMEADPTVRVLWIAHQQELLEQAGRAFVKAAGERPDGFTRRLRLLVGGGPGLVTLTDPELDVVLTSRQLLKASGRLGEKRLEKFLTRPTIVIVDEAHHASSPSYENILNTVVSAAGTTLLGLTATPWPAASGARRRLRERFPREFARPIEGLMQSGVLAVPVFHTVATHQRVTMTADQAQIAETRDFPPEVLRVLANHDRDAIIVNTWVQHADQWGKTLVFATSIDHADKLTAALQNADVSAECIHSQVPDPSGVLGSFRRVDGPQVLVSVGMLTEGVDVPAARTAFLARPTTSPILMRQMIGRVLRGPDAGGDPFAHIVYLQDQWGDFLDAVEPPDLADIHGQAAGPSGRPGAVLPPVYDDTGELVELDLINQLAQDALRAHVALPLNVAATAAEIVGYYELGDTRMLVLGHQKDAFNELINHTLSGGQFRGRSPLAFFEDLPAPAPSKRRLHTLVSWMREYEEQPAFHPLAASLDPKRFAAELRQAPAMTVDERHTWLRQRYEASAMRALFADFDQFEEAVEDSVRNLLRAIDGRRPHENLEGPIPLSATKRRKALPRATRDLAQLLDRVAVKARDLLADEFSSDADLEARLNVTHLPIRFSRGPRGDAWAYWSLKAGQPTIVVNKLLETTPAAVPDETLEYLIYHELLHHLLPGQGHDVQFRRLESLWPGIDQAELALMTLHERWDTRPVSRA